MAKKKPSEAPRRLYVTTVRVSGLPLPGVPFEAPEDIPAVKAGLAVPLPDPTP